MCTWWVCSFPRAAVIKYCRVGDLKQEFILSEFWSLELGIKVSAGYPPSEDSREEFFLASSELRVVTGNPWSSLADRSLQLLPLSLDVFLYVSLHLCFLIL